MKPSNYSANAMNLHPSQLDMNARLQANLLAGMQDQQSSAFRASSPPQQTLMQQQRLIQQQAMARRVAIPKPGKNDVILGRGKPFQNWPGNQFMLSLCDCYRERYHAAERAQKNCIIDEVKDIIKGRGGRFLRKYERRAIFQLRFRRTKGSFVSFFSFQSQSVTKTSK